MFQCSSGDCIPESYNCDGITEDCPDNEDENKEQCGIEGKGISFIRSQYNLLKIPFRSYMSFW